MTKTVGEKAMVFIINLHQSDIAKLTERNNAEPYNKYYQRTFLRYFLLAG